MARAVSVARRATLGLIVPLWNWNVEDVAEDSDNAERFNRTFMELKFLSRGFHTDRSQWFNRTFMELKSPCRGGRCAAAILGLIVPLWNWNTWWLCAPRWCGQRFNRTFMELKSFTSGGVTLSRAGLIVPLWNWNYMRMHTSDGVRGFNRTFMELK